MIWSTQSIIYSHIFLCDEAKGFDPPKETKPLAADELSVMSADLWEVLFFLSKKYLGCWIIC